jgi:hypothetical protein
MYGFVYLLYPVLAVSTKVQLENILNIPNLQMLYSPAER